MVAECDYLNRFKGSSELITHQSYTKGTTYQLEIKNGMFAAIANDHVNIHAIYAFENGQMTQIDTNQGFNTLNVSYIDGIFSFYENQWNSDLNIFKMN